MRDGGPGRPTEEYYGWSEKGTGGRRLLRVGEVFFQDKGEETGVSVTFVTLVFPSVPPTFPCPRSDYLVGSQEFVVPGGGRGVVTSSLVGRGSPVMYVGTIDVFRQVELIAQERPYTSRTLFLYPRKLFTPKPSPPSSHRNPSTHRPSGVPTTDPNLITLRLEFSPLFLCPGAQVPCLTT